MDIKTTCIGWFRCSVRADGSAREGGSMDTKTTRIG